MLKKIGFPVSAFYLVFSVSCSSRHQSDASSGAEIPAPTQTQISQNLQNKRVPSPSEVITNAVPVAADACQTFRATIPADWQQGFLTVPEDPSNPSGTQIHVFYYGKINPNSTPTIYFNGGPGDDSHSDFTVMTRKQPLFDPSKQISFVFIDQRGNGCSDNYPQGYDPATLNRLRNYGTRGIVTDAEAARAVLWSGKPWISAGQSYGGFISHRYTALFPQALKAAFSEQEVLSADSYTRIKIRVESQNRVMAIYLAQYPDDVKRLQDLRSYLVPAQCFSSSEGSEKVCGWRVLSPLMNLLGFSDQWLPIHEWIGVMDHTDTGISTSGIARFLATFYFGPSNPLNIKGYATSVIGWVDRNEPPLDADHCEKIQADLQAQGIDLSQVLLNECMAALQSPPVNPTDTSLWLQTLPQDLLTIADFSAQLQKFPTLQFFLYSADRDPYVPKEQFADELAAIGSLPNVHYTNFPGTGHDASYNESAAWNDLIKESSL